MDQGCARVRSMACLFTRYGGIFCFEDGHKQKCCITEVIEASPFDEVIEATKIGLAELESLMPHVAALMASRPLVGASRV